MAGPGNILIKVGADAGQAVRELSSLNSSLGDTMSTHEKMSAGIALTDDDRWPWLEKLAKALRLAAEPKGVAVGA